MKNNTTFGERIRGIRIEKGVSLTQAAADMEISQGALSDYERDRKLPGYDVIQKLSRYYDVCYEYLFGESEAKQADNIDIVKSLGLSEMTVEVLKRYASLAAYMLDAPYPYDREFRMIYFIDRFFHALNHEGVFSIACDIGRRMTLTIDQGLSSRYISNGKITLPRDGNKEANRCLQLEPGECVLDAFEHIDFLHYQLSEAMGRAARQALEPYISRYTSYKNKMIEQGAQEADRIMGEDSAH